MFVTTDRRWGAPGALRFTNRKSDFCCTANYRIICNFFSLCFVFVQSEALPVLKH